MSSDNSLLQLVFSQLDAQNRSSTPSSQPPSNASTPARTSPQTEPDGSSNEDLSAISANTPGHTSFSPSPFYSAADSSQSSLNLGSTSASPSISTLQDASETSSIKSGTTAESPGATIQLNDRGLTFIPLELINVMKSTVSKLTLQANLLSSLPMEMATMEFLTYLDISHNNFSEFPTVVCAFSILSTDSFTDFFFYYFF